MKRNPPSLVSLAVDSAIHNLPLFSDLSFLPDHILLDLFLKTLRAGKLTEKILKLFVATGKEEILAVIAALNIKYVITPVLPTRSQQKYVISIDDDCIPAEDARDNLVGVVAQHITNLKTPATLFFCNTLYGPFCKGTDFVHGHPFTPRSLVPSALSCGLWLNLAHYDAPTQALKPEQTNNRYVEDVLTIPVRTLMLLGGESLEEEWQGLKLVDKVG